MSVDSQHSVIHVAAGVLSDARGRVLLARRTAGRDLAGAWEFPGGKLEPGESPLSALRRELHEELGVHLVSAEPLITVPYAYPGKRIVLDVYRVTEFTGAPRGRERQALAWVPLEKLPRYSMPPADIPVVAALTQPECYLITPPGLVNLDPGALQSLKIALENGIRRVQLRLRHEDRRHLPRCAEIIKPYCDSYRAELLINNDISLAQTLGCGVHLSAKQMMALRERPLPMNQSVAASCHNEMELHHAQSLGLDFVVLGPVAKTPSHPEVPPLGWSGFAVLREQVSLPIYALGGMCGADLIEARRYGAQGIAAIRGLWPVLH